MMGLYSAVWWAARMEGTMAAEKGPLMAESKDAVRVAWKAAKKGRLRAGDLVG
jgi:hypothetical protein